MPGKGKYTTYHETDPVKIPRKNYRDSLFKGGPFSGLKAEEVKEEVVNRGNKILRAEAGGGKTSGDSSMFPNGVDLTYSGGGMQYGPANGSVPTDRAGDPMNAFVPDVSSPGPGKTGGLDKDPALNPKKTPEEYKETFDGSYVPSANTRLPKGSVVYEKNVLGESNSFDTKNVEQYPE
jgi:hypothetical protein